MPVKFNFNGATGRTHDAVILNPIGLVWNGTSFVTVSGVVRNYANVSTVETATPGYFEGEFPAGITTPGDYTVLVYRWSGGSQAPSDPMIAAGSVTISPGTIQRPRMEMVPFSPTMYNDDVVFYRVTKVTSGQGGTSNTYPTNGIPMMANVQSRMVERAQSNGTTRAVTLHVVSTPSDIMAKPDDRFEWMGRKLLVEAATIPKGTGNVTFHTPCVESK